MGQSTAQPYGSGSNNASLNFDWRLLNYIMRTPTLLILLLVLLVSGCSTTRNDANFTELEAYTIIASTPANGVPASNSYPRRSVAPEPVKIEPAFNRMADRTYRLPVLARENRIQKANVMNTLVSDLGLVVDGELELSEVTDAFERFADRYEMALEGTVEYYERTGSKSGGRAVADSSAYESAVKLWMAVSGGDYDKASFERWARSLLEGYRLDLQISDSVTADENFRQEVENYLW